MKKMTTKKVNDKCSLSMDTNEAQILKHIIGSIVFAKLEESVTSDGYYIDEIDEMKEFVNESFIKLNDELGRD